MKSQKQFAYDHLNGDTKYRTPQPAGSKGDHDNFFQWSDESDYLIEALNGVPYATYRTDESEDMADLMENGFEDREGTIWMPFFAYWKEQEGRAYMAPKDAGLNDLRDVGVHTIMKDQADFMKVAKYANRLFAPLMPKSLDATDHYGSSEGIWGKEVSWSPEDNEAIVQLEVADERKIVLTAIFKKLKNNKDFKLEDSDLELSIKYVDLGTLSEDEAAAVDGAIVVSEKACVLLGLSREPFVGMAWRGTFGTERGLGKGHILYVNNMDVDVVIYGTKTILKTDKFFFGSMGKLHVDEPHTDRQAFVNFQFHRKGLGVELAKSYLREVNEASKDEAGLRRLFLKHTQSINPTDLDHEGWVLSRALAYGISFLAFPGLFRRVVRYLMKTVMQMEDKIRIPMGSIAGYGYVLPDPNIITSDGTVDLSLSGIPEGHIVFPDVEPGTKVVCYRQPSENTNAWVPLTVTQRPEYRKFAGRGICLLGKGAKSVLARLGGGDMDDSFIIVHDQVWVEAFHTMRPYPETEKLDTETTDEDQSLFDQEQTGLFGDIRDENISHYTNRHVSWQIELAKNTRANIGQVVNYGVFDMLLSDPDHKQSMLEELDARDTEEATEAADWLEAYVPYQAAKLMTNLEYVIDGNVKDPALLRKLGDVSGQIKAFHKECLIYPESMAGMAGRTRVPLSKIEMGGYTVAKTLFCKALAEIISLRKRLDDVFMDRQWAIVAPAHRELRDSGYAFERELSILVRGQWRRVVDPEPGQKPWERVDEDTRSLMDIWAQEWRDELSQERDHSKAYDRITGLIAAELDTEDSDYMERLAVEVYYQTYKTYEVAPRFDEATGEARNFKDALLWSPVFGNHFINALRSARLAGYYKYAEIRPEFRKRVQDKTLEVEIRSHNVYVQDSNDEYTVWAGFIMGKSRNGKYMMDSGLIEFKAPQPICLPHETAGKVVAQRPLFRLFPSKVQPSAEPVKETPITGVVGKLLKKAFDLLK